MQRKWVFVTAVLLGLCGAALAANETARAGASPIHEGESTLRFARLIKRMGPECRPRQVANFVNNGGNPNGSVNGTRLLSFALLEGADDCALALLHHGASADFKTPYGPFLGFALSITAGANACEPEAIAALIKRGANPNGYWVETTPLFGAAMAKNIECAAALIKAGAKVNALNGPRGDTALMSAQMMGFRGNGDDLKDREQMTRLLLSQGANPNVALKDIPGGHALAGITAIFYAAGPAHWMAPCPVCVSELVKHGANPNAIDAQGDTPLLWSLAPKHRTSVAVVAALIRGGADVDLGNSKTGRTPLMAAAAQGFTAIVDLLLKNGADRCALDKLKRSASTYARQNGQSKLAQAVACQEK